MVCCCSADSELLAMTNVLHYYQKRLHVYVYQVRHQTQPSAAALRKCGVCGGLYVEGHLTIASTQCLHLFVSGFCSSTVACELFWCTNLGVLHW
jgi:hypothetical protein